MFFLIILISNLMGSEGCNNKVSEKYIIKPTCIGNYCKKKKFNLEYITPDGANALLQEAPYGKKWNTVVCKVQKRSIKKIFCAKSFNGQGISPVPLTLFNQIAWSYIYKNKLTWKTFDTNTEKFRQITTDVSIFGPNFITEDFVMGFDAEQMKSGPLLRSFSKNSNQQLSFFFKNSNTNQTILELNDKKNTYKCLCIAENWLLFETKGQKFLDMDTRQYNESICVLSHDKKTCVVSKGIPGSLYLLKYGSQLSIREFEGKFGQACFSYDDSCIYCLDMENSLIKKYCLNNHSFETIMPFDAKNYPNYRLFPMQEGGFLMYWPQLNYAHIKPKNE